MTPNAALNRIFEATIGETARRYHARRAARMKEEAARARKLAVTRHAIGITDEAERREHCTYNGRP